MNTDIVARLLVAALTFYTPYAAVSIPSSIANRMISMEGLTAYPLLAVMVFLSIVIFVDVVANSMCPYSRCGIKILTHFRDTLYMGCAFCVLVPLFSVSKYSTIDPAANYLYLVIFSGALSLAWCDAYEKHGVNRGPTLS
jgi:hypothetical protein